MKGSIDLLLLSLIEQRDLYGYEMTRIIKHLSNDAYEMSETLSLHSKEWNVRTGLLIWKETDSGRRKYYHISQDGKVELEQKKENWEWMNDLIKRSSESLI